MPEKATGTFEVKIVPQTDREIPTLGRMTIDKQFRGDLEAASQGQMLSTRGAIPNSAVYVAMERVEGTLHGKKGSFVLHHTGIMNRGESSLVVTIAPDSGTDELEGISGALKIIIAGGVHAYEMEYTLPTK